jgi:isoleucyl-tRNA synthetase
MFNRVEAAANFPELDRKVLAFWRENEIPRQSFHKEPTLGEYVFFEGPPTANGKPGIHHVLARIFKDLVPRYKTMRGYRVRRRGGWDTHGLPVEIEVERQIGSTGKRDIERYGIAEFNALCRSSVFRYIQDWNDLTERIGFWLDLERAYITYDNSYIETCWWILKDLWDRNLLYEDYKTTMHCPRCNSTLADHEVSQGMKEDVDDPSVWPKFPADKEGLKQSGILPDADIGPVFFLAWTTTPWTLGANVALAVKADAEYALVSAPPSFGDKTSPRVNFILAANLAKDSLGEYQVRSVFPGSRLVGAGYSPVMRGYVPASEDAAKAYRVITDESVSVADGTGIVHIAPAYGDLEIGKKNNLPTFFSVDLEGRVYPEVGLTPESRGKYAGMFFKEADKSITEDLHAAGLMFRSERVKHAYPFCWRDDSPLLFYAKNTWYIRTSALKSALLANNEKINWIPAHIRNGRFGNWLENNVDWALSRERYWGAPLPIWISDDCSERLCIGSVAELESLVGRSLSGLDLHRPSIDEVTFVRNGKKFKRLPFTVDVWFESGAMPYAQWHYPFENRDEFVRSFPADYICEAMDQTRGWFYSLHALATLLSEPGSPASGIAPGPLASLFPASPAFKNCMVVGFVNDAKGQKMSKSRGNTVDPWAVLDKFGADPLRWYLYTVTAPDLNKNFDEEQLTQVVRGFFLTLWNCYSFFVMYANLDQPRLAEPLESKNRPAIDRWILARTDQVVKDVTRMLDGFEIPGAARAISDFVINDVSNWYIRLNRRRYWRSDEGSDKQAAYLTLHEVLSTVARLCAPLAPFVSEEMYQNLVRNVWPKLPPSVHLDSWPGPNAQWSDDAIVRQMEIVSRLVELGRAARSKAGVKIRQPLAYLAIASQAQPVLDAVEKFQDLIKEELNVKAVRFVANASELMKTEYSLDIAKAGAAFGGRLPEVRKAFALVPQAEIERSLAQAEEVQLALPDEVVRLDATYFIGAKKPAADYAVAEEGGYLVGLYTMLTPELKKEGAARDLVRLIQDARKKAGLEVSERIDLQISAPPQFVEIVSDQMDYISGEVLAKSISFNGESSYPHRAQIKVAGSALEIAFRKHAVN